MKNLILTMITTSLLLSCAPKQQEADSERNEEFNYNVEKFADIGILRYRVDGFEDLTAKQKEMLYYLSQAALEGRDILYDQNCKWNLPIRRTLEVIYNNYNGDKNHSEYLGMVKYLKQIWFANGIHHHYSTDKFTPEFSEEFFIEQINTLSPEILPLDKNETVKQFTETIIPVIFDPSIMSKRVNQMAGADLVATSASNYYDGVTQNEVEQFYTKIKDPNEKEPVMYGLNSKVTKENGEVVEKVWKIGGMYSDALKRVVHWLEKAKEVAENDLQKQYIQKLIEFNETGDLKSFDEYAVLWVKDTESDIDFVNGFTETYGDPLGMKASWESLVNFKNKEASKRTKIISDNAQWFENNSPIDSRFKKDVVTGVSAKVINAVMLGGDCYPSTPIGVNLPNSNWIRATHGSKSVTIENITSAYDKASQGNGFADEFAWSEEDNDLMSEYGFMTDNLNIDLHECLGHGSGKILDSVDPDALKEHGSALEETRADLFALYYIADPKMVELGLLPNNIAYKAQYYKYLLNGLMTQLIRIEKGKDIEQAHMRNRQLISNWVLTNGAEDKVIELRERDGKTYLVICDYEKLRLLFGSLLSEVQRIKSEGDYLAGKKLVDTYGTKVDQNIHKEVLSRNKALKILPYKGFLNPIYTPIYNKTGNIIDVEVSYDESYVEQHLRYSKEYSPLGSYN